MYKNIIVVVSSVQPVGLMCPSQVFYVVRYNNKKKKTLKMSNYFNTVKNYFILENSDQTK